MINTEYLLERYFEDLCSSDPWRQARACKGLIERRMSCLAHQDLLRQCLDRLCLMAATRGARCDVRAMAIWALSEYAIHYEQVGNRGLQLSLGRCAHGGGRVGRWYELPIVWLVSKVAIRRFTLLPMPYEKGGSN